MNESINLYLGTIQLEWKNNTLNSIPKSISDGRRFDSDKYIGDKNLLSKFKVVVMSEDDEVQIRKPNPQIFNIAVSKVSEKLGEKLAPQYTSFMTEKIDQFRKYNFEFSR
jgi:beta-phosphoglucomutase-like phosphatase (HAD superfamily)